MSTTDCDDTPCLASVSALDIADDPFQHCESDDELTFDMPNDLAPCDFDDQHDADHTHDKHVSNDTSHGVPASSSSSSFQSSQNIIVHKHGAGTFGARMSSARANFDPFADADHITLAMSKLTNEKLADKCKQLHIPTSGCKIDLIKRIRQKLGIRDR